MIRLLLRALLRVYFRRVEVVGAEHVPGGGAAVFAPNHPNSLLDPLVLFASVARPVSTLAAEPLFRKPLLGWVMRSIGAIPVYRREDQADRSKNRETFRAAREHLAGGGAIAIFPEGVSHDDPSLRPIRTGAARIALGVNGAGPVLLVPTGLFYTARTHFRSDALVCFGEPIPVHPAPVEEGEPSPDAVQALTSRLETAMAALLLQAKERKELRLVAAAERIFTTADAAPADLQTVLRRRRRMVARYAEWREKDPDRVRVLEARVRRYQRWLTATGLEYEHLPPGGFRPLPVARMIGVVVPALVLLTPLALVGIAMHFPAWHLTRWLAHRRFARSGRGEDVLGTMKLTVGLVTYPLTWLAMGFAGWLIGGPIWGGAAAALGPLTGALALRFRMRWAQLTATLRGLLLALFGTRLYRRMLAERRRLRAEFEALERSA